MCASVSRIREEEFRQCPQIRGSEPQIADCRGPNEDVDFNNLRLDIRQSAVHLDRKLVAFAYQHESVIFWRERYMDRQTDF